MQDERLISIETKIAYQDDTIQQLNEVIIAQQKELEKLQVQLAALEKKVLDLAEIAGEASVPKAERPPHY